MRRNHVTPKHIEVGH